MIFASTSSNAQCLKITTTKKLLTQEIFVFVTCEKKCRNFTTENDRVGRREKANTVNFAEEADTRMIYHDVASLPSHAIIVLRVLCIAV